MGNKGLFPVVAVPLAFFGTFFRVERKYCPPRGGSPIRPRRSRRVSPTGEGFFYSKVAVRYCKQGAFRSPFGNLRAPKVARNPPESSHQAPARPLRPPHAGASPRHSCRVPTQAEFCSTPPPSGTLPQKFFLAIMPNFPTRAARFSLFLSSYG